MIQTSKVLEKILVIADVPSPHQNIFFDAVARHDDADLLVYFCRKTVPVRAYSGEGPRIARHEILTPYAINGIPTNPSLLAKLLYEGDRLPVVIGYYLPGMVTAGLALSAFRRPWIFWTDTLPPPTNAVNLRSFGRNRVRRWFLTHATFCASTGPAGREALMACGVDKERAHILPFVVDRERIAAEVDRARCQRHALLTQLGLDPTCRTLLFVGQMILRKGIDILLKAFASAECQQRLQLLLVGEGEDLGDFRAQALHLNIRDRVVFHPYVDNAELPRFWAAVDGLVLPSRFDAWPVVVIEAMAAGLPVIGTRACGSVRDGVVPGKSGWIVEPEDVESTTVALCEFADLADSELAKMRASARASMQQWSAEAVANDFVNLARRARLAGRRG